MKIEITKEQYNLIVSSLMVTIHHNRKAENSTDVLDFRKATRKRTNEFVNMLEYMESERDKHKSLMGLSDSPYLNAVERSENKAP